MKLTTTLLGLLCLSGLAGAAENPPPKPDDGPTHTLVIRLEVVQLNDEAFFQLSDQARLPDSFLEKGRGRVLHSAELMGGVEEDALFFLGHKSPIVYYDPRNSQFQIQYVDSGVKMDVKTKLESQGTYQVEIYPEVSVIETNRVVGTAPATVSYPQTTLFTSNTSLSHVHVGESVIIGRSHGTAARRFLESLGSGLTSAGENVVTVLTLNEL